MFSNVVLLSAVVSDLCMFQMEEIEEEKEEVGEAASQEQAQSSTQPAVKKLRGINHGLNVCYVA